MFKTHSKFIWFRKEERRLSFKYPYINVRTQSLYVSSRLRTFSFVNNEFECALKALLTALIAFFRKNLIFCTLIMHIKQIIIKEYYSNKIEKIFRRCMIGIVHSGGKCNCLDIFNLDRLILISTVSTVSLHFSYSFHLVFLSFSIPFI